MREQSKAIKELKSKDHCRCERQQIGHWKKKTRQKENEKGRVVDQIGYLKKKNKTKRKRHVVLNCLGHIWGSNWSFHWKKKNKTKSKKKVELNCLDHWGSMWRRESDIAPALFAWNHKYGLDIARNKVHRAFWDMILP